MSSSPIDATKHTLRQAQLGRELQELNKALAMKQELAQTMGQNDEKMTVMKMHYEVSCFGLSVCKYYEFFVLSVICTMCLVPVQLL